MTRTTIAALALVAVLGMPSTITAQEEEDEADREEESVIIPSQMKLNDEQKAAVQKKIESNLVDALKKCVAKYPRPEFFTSVGVQYSLKKSGDLRGGYLPGTTPDSALYVASDEELEKKKKEGALTRLIVRNDRDLERCMKKETREIESGLSKYSATITADFTIAWEAKKPTLEATKFDVKKK